MSTVATSHAMVPALGRCALCGKHQTMFTSPTETCDAAIPVTTDDIRRGFVGGQSWAGTKRAAMFDRWLAAHDREVAAKTWDEGYETGSEDEMFNQRGSWADPDKDEFPHKNPYRQEGGNG